MTDIEIPYKEERGVVYRFFEILPGLLSWSLLFMPAVLAFIDPVIAAYVITIYLCVWFVRSMVMTVRTLQSYRLMKMHCTMDWQPFIDDITNAKEAYALAVAKGDNYSPMWHRANLKTYITRHPSDSLTPENLVHAFVIPFHKEGREILQPSLDTLAAANYNMKNVIVVLTAEERAGKQAGRLARELAHEFKGSFRRIIATVHPQDLPDEIKGKGPNANWGMRALKTYVDAHHIPYEHVVVTSLDCDHRIHPSYLKALTYFYLICPDRMNTSFQPIAMFTNNIWDAPAPMRVIATGNSFWNMIVSLRPHILRNFASHAQSLKALIEVGYYSTRTIVEDGHQYWRTYFKFDGRHDVFPLFTPIYQDAVLAGSLWQTIKEQFYQLRRWTYGASDIPYVAYRGFFTKNHISKMDVLFKFLRLLESHVSWATTSLILLFGALVAANVNPAAKESIVANQLPMITSRIQTVALVGIIATLFLSMKLLPPRPERYGKWRYIPMALQWLLMPITTIMFASTAAFNSQTRLMFGKYLDVFDATVKFVKK